MSSFFNSTPVIDDDFDTPKIRVLRKLQSSEKYVKAFDKDDLVTLAEILCSPVKLRQTYLTTRWTETFKVINSAPKKQKKLKSVSFNSKSKVEEEIQDFDLYDLPEDDESHQDAIFEKEIKIKLLITEIAESDLKKLGRSLISPVLTTLNRIPHFGIFHTSLIIGPWLLEWNNSSICIPRRCISKAALIAMDVGTILTHRKVSDVVDILADEIAKWNSDMLYLNTPKDKSVQGNCQDFVESILAKILVEYKFEGALGSYLKKMKQDGNCQMSFESTDEEFLTKFGLKKRVTFDSHLELDNFVCQLFKIDCNFEKNYPNEYALLKSFDRSFWLRSYGSVSDKKYKSKKFEDENGELYCDCPFGDPEQTQSIHFEKK